MSSPYTEPSASFVIWLHFLPLLFYLLYSVPGALTILLFLELRGCATALGSWNYVFPLPNASFPQISLCSYCFNVIFLGGFLRSHYMKPYCAFTMCSYFSSLLNFLHCTCCIWHSLFVSYLSFPPSIMWVSWEHWSSLLCFLLHLPLPEQHMA